MCISGGGGDEEEFTVELDLRQGCPLSPWLFNVFLGSVAREAMVGFQGVEQDSCLIQIFCRQHSDVGPDRKRPKPECGMIP